MSDFNPSYSMLYVSVKKLTTVLARVRKLHIWIAFRTAGGRTYPLSKIYSSAGKALYAMFW